MTSEALKLEEERTERQQMLTRRMNEFVRAMAAGGRRDSFLGWQASRTALAAAVEILAVLETRQ